MSTWCQFDISLFILVKMQAEVISMATRKSKHPQYTLRIPQEQLDKIRYIAEYNARSCNKEIERLVRIHIKNFEKMNGEITRQDIENFNRN